MCPKGIICQYRDRNRNMQALLTERLSDQKGLLNDQHKDNWAGNISNDLADDSAYDKRDWDG